MRDTKSVSGSIPLITAPFGALMVGVIIDKLGRRAALLSSICPSIVGWMLLWWDFSIAAKYAGQALAGVSAGAFGYPTQVYAGECLLINHVYMRSSFLAWYGVMNAVGMALILFLGYFWSYHNLCALLVLLSAASFLLIFFFIPESPSWLYIHGRQGDAELSQTKLGIVQPILQDGNVVEIFGMFTIDTDEPLTWASIKKHLLKVKREDVYRPLLIMTAFFIISTLSGGLAVITYMVDIINEVSKREDGPPSFLSQNRLASTDTYEYSVFSGGIILGANFLMFVAVPWLGVRKVLMTSSTLMAVGYVALGYSTIENLFTVHVLSVWLVIFAINFGIMNLPNALLGDLFPVDAKGYASVVYIIEFLTTAVLVKVHPYLRIDWGGYIYYTYAVISLMTTVFLHFFMMETVGKTLGQINREFLGVR